MTDPKYTNFRALDPFFEISASARSRKTQSKCEWLSSGEETRIGALVKKSVS